MTREVTTVSTTDTPEEVQAAQAHFSAAEKGAEGAEGSESLEAATDEALEAAEADETPVVEVAPAATAAVPVKPLSKSAQRKLKIKADIDELTRQKYEVSREVAKEEGRLEALRGSEGAGPGETPTPKQAASAPAPDPEPSEQEVDAHGNRKYADYDSWDKAWRKWSVSNRDTEISTRVNTEVDRRLSEHGSQQKYTADVAAFHEAMDVSRARHEDFDAVTEAGSDLPITPDMHERIVHRQLGPEVLYHLCTNPDDCRRISTLSARDAVTELAIIEGDLARRLGAASPSRGSAPKPPPISRASRPITPLGPGASATAETLEAVAERNDFQAYKRRRLSAR